MNKYPKVVVIGSLNMDYSIETDCIPERGETVLANKMQTFFGGKGANQAVAAARAGAQVSIIGAIGHDQDGDAILSMLKNEGINTEGILLVPNEKTGNAIITVCEGDNRIIVVPGANLHCTVNHVTKYLHIIDGADVVLMQLEIPIETIKYVTDYASLQQKKIILNPAPMRDLPPELLSKVTVLTPNEGELEGILRHHNFKEPQDLFKLGVRSLVITQGENGACYVTKEHYIHIPGNIADVVDTTGAGDCFNGFFAANYTENSDISDIINIANLAASVSVTRKGAINSIPTQKELGGIRR